MCVWRLNCFYVYVCVWGERLKCLCGRGEEVEVFVNVSGD